MAPGRTSELEDRELAIKDLTPESYTALRLQHATPQHIHLTTRRTFIGPIPEGWLKSHRKAWYKQSLTFSNYSSRTATFSASLDTSYHRSLTGRGGLSSFNASFPQPDDVDEDVDEEENGKLGQRLYDDQTAEASGALKSKLSSRMYQKRGSNNDLKIKSKKYLGNHPNSSFVTAQESIEPIKSPESENGDQRKDQGADQGMEIHPKSDVMSGTSIHEIRTNSTPDSVAQLTNSDEDSSPVARETTSTASLIPHGLTTISASPLSNVQAEGSLLPLPNPMSPGLVRFNLPEASVEEDLSKQKQAQKRHRRSWRQLRRGKSHPGEIIKMEKMLVKVDSTMQELPSGYNENDSLKTESRTVDKWSEFIVVCRESVDDESDFSIQMYKSRVIPAIEKSSVSKRSIHDIPLIRRSTKVNLYSSLDKTLVIWVPWKNGTRIYILRTHSSASAVEWYTFIRSSLGWRRSSNLQVNVPDLSVTLQLEDPFGELEASRFAAEACEEDEVAVMRSLEAEKAVAGRIIQSCMQMLEDSPEWIDVLEDWMKNEKMGLAWKRYDRLEWVHGANEQRMYGSIAMQKSHDLELRPKQHYPTCVKSKDEAVMDEPSPIEGFLIRLTSQKGQVRRYGKMFYKRLYFSTHNQFLCYCRPVKALPPPPPKLTLGGDSTIPSAHQIVNRTPVIYAVDPYPTSEGEITWLRHGTAQSKEKHDNEAYKEAERKINTMLHAEGYLNLAHVVRVRNTQMGATPADANIEQGPDVDFHEEVADSRHEDGKTKKFEDDRTFEVVLKNGLVVRLQAYNERTKKEWMTGLEKLIKYWKIRLAEDMNAFKSIRQLNLETLGIDEEVESSLGQFAEKWEVTRAEASPQLFHMCGISCCRTITLSGILYRKPTRHSTFIRCGVILCHGQLLIFHGSLRERTGKEVPHIQHDRETAINLKDCYIYSGLVTDGDLLYQNQTFDSNHPGHHALPRIYLEDGWTSTDEDTMTCFVIWHSKRKSFFRANGSEGEGKGRRRLRYVSRLGVPGSPIVFRSRSRAERDHWVLAIGMEIDRLQSREDIRVVS